ncbi:MAG: ThuA domain-containing protein [Blastocatellia bacterium]
MTIRKIPISPRLFAGLTAIALFVAWMTHPTCACGPKQNPLERILERFGGAAPTATTAAAQRKTRLLFVTQCKGFRHQVLHQAEEIVEQLGAKNGFDVTITQMAENKLTPENLKNLDVIVFYTTGELPLSDEQKKAFLDWIKSGKFFLGIHSATDTFYKWPEYGQMIGGYFNKHPWNQDTEVTIKAEDRAHPVTRHLPEGWSMKEEIYQIKDFIGRDKAHVLVSLDQTKTDMNKPGVEAKDFPLVWWRDYGKGKVMYNAMGHRPDVWTKDWYQTMIVNSIKWGTGQMK